MSSRAEQGPVSSRAEQASRAEQGPVSSRAEQVPVSSRAEHRRRKGGGSRGWSPPLIFGSPSSRKCSDKLKDLTILPR